VGIVGAVGVAVLVSTPTPIRAANNRLLIM
jgi:hypothetical protein